MLQKYPKPTGYGELKGIFKVSQNLQCQIKGIPWLLTVACHCVDVVHSHTTKKNSVYFFFVWSTHVAENIWIACLKLHNNSLVLYLTPSSLRVCVCVFIWGAAVVMGVKLKDWQSISSLSLTLLSAQWLHRSLNTSH